MAPPRKPQDRLSKAVAPEPLGIVQLVTPEEPEEVGRLDVFSIDGVTYSMPGVVDASVSLRCLDMVRRYGQEAALSWLLEEMFGTKGYQALINFRGLTKDQFGSIAELVRAHAMGELEDELRK